MFKYSRFGPDEPIFFFVRPSIRLDSEQFLHKAYGEISGIAKVYRRCVLYYPIRYWIVAVRNGSTPDNVVFQTDRKVFRKAICQAYTAMFVRVVRAHYGVIKLACNRKYTEFLDIPLNLIEERLSLSDLLNSLA